MGHHTQEVLGALMESGEVGLRDVELLKRKKPQITMMPHASTEQITGSGVAGSGHAPRADSHRSTPICEWQGAGWTDSCTAPPKTLGKTLGKWGFT